MGFNEIMCVKCSACAKLRLRALVLKLGPAGTLYYPWASPKVTEQKGSIFLPGQNSPAKEPQRGRSF